MPRARLRSVGRGAGGSARATPASSSCITIMFTSIGTEGRPVSTTKCAVSRYSGSRSRVQLAQPAQRIGHLQQRPLDVVAQAPEQLLGRGAQVDHVEVRAQLRRDWPRAARRRRRSRRTPSGRRRQLGDHVLLDVAEALLRLRARSSRGSSSRCAARSRGRCRRREAAGAAPGAGRLSTCRRRASRRVRSPRVGDNAARVSARRCGR